MSVAIEEQYVKPFRVPGYAGYVPGLKYLFGHTYGYSESRLFKSQHPDLNCGTPPEKLTPYQPPLRNSHIRKVDDPCLQRNGVHQKISKADDEPRHVQFPDGSNHQDQVQGGMDVVDSSNLEDSFHEKQHAAIQCSLEETLAKDEEREGVRSAATQWSDQEAHRKKRSSAATQWSPIDFSALKTIPGYTDRYQVCLPSSIQSAFQVEDKRAFTAAVEQQMSFGQMPIERAGHLPGRHYVNPGKTFCQEVDALLTTFHPKSQAVQPLSRYNFTSALQQMPERPPEGKNDPYFDNRPPSTYDNNYPIPGYQGFVPRVRTSTSSLGVRYIKAVKNSLHALHEQKQRELNQDRNPEDENLNSPRKLLDRRPLHTPRHKPHPRQQVLEEDDWRLIYRRPPSTYHEDAKTFIPGYKGFVPHLRCSPNAVGIRYSKAAQRCLLKSHPKPKNNMEQFTHENREGDIEPQESSNPDNEQQSGHAEENKENEHGNGNGDNENNNGDAIADNPNDFDHTEYEENNNEEYNDADAAKTNSMKDHRLQRHDSSLRPFRQQQYNDYMSDRKPSTYRSDERYPIPGYQGFVPRLRDSPTTLGLRYTKAAFKTLEDVHRMQARKE